MELRRIDIDRAADPGMVRLCGEIRYDAGHPDTEILWFAVPHDLAGFLSSSGNPWLACLLPLAATLGERLRLRVPVDQRLVEGARRLNRVWKQWYPNLSEVDIEAESGATFAGQGDRKTAAFMSGGVDSFFTVLHAAPTYEVDDLLFVHGFDRNLREPDRLQATLEEVAAGLGRRLVTVRTNLRQSRFREAWFGGLAHGPALASVALALEKRYANVLISSTHAERQLIPWGSHPATDPLLSTRQTEIVHFGAAFDRVQKCKVVFGSELALRFLRVCPTSPVVENCGHCQKCLRTMIAMELLDALGRCRTLARPLKIDVIGRIFLRDANQLLFFDELRLLALSQGRRDISAAIDLSVARSARARSWLTAVDRIRKIPLAWRLAKPLERFVLWSQGLRVNT